MRMVVRVLCGWRRLALMLVMLGGRWRVVGDMMRLLLWRLRVMDGGELVELELLLLLLATTSVVVGGGVLEEGGDVHDGGGEDGSKGRRLRKKPAPRPRKMCKAITGTIEIALCPTLAFSCPPQPPRPTPTPSLLPPSLSLSLPAPARPL